MKILTNPRHIFIGFLVIFFLHIALYLFLFTRADRITPPGHVHTIHPLDAYYPDVIRQSKLGAWSIIDTHTTLPTPRILSYFFFVAAGKVAAVFSIDPVVMYEITRFAGGIAVLVATYWLITLILPVPLQLVGLFFTMVFDTGPVWEAVMKTPIWQWTAASPGQILTARHFGFPHHLWGEAFGLALICMVIRAIKKPGHLTPLIIVFLGLASVSTSPPYPVILITCLFGPWLIWALITKNIKKTFPPIVLAVGAIIAGGLFIKLQFAKGPPWDSFVAVEKQWWTTNEILIPFIQSFGLYYPFAAVVLLLAPFAWRKWSPAIRQAFVLALGWTVLPVGLIYLSKLSWFPIANGRIASDLSRVPIGILATVAVYTVYKSAFLHRSIKIIVLSLFALLCGISLFLSHVYIKQLMRDQDRGVNGEGYSFIYYPTQNLWNGIMALKDVPPYSHVMTLPRVGETMPALLAVRAYQGAPHSFADWFERRGLSHVFYTGEMPHEELIDLLKKNKISYVFLGPEEKYPVKTVEFYPDVLEIIYQNPEVTIYKVKAGAF